MITEVEFIEARESGATVYKVGCDGLVEPVVFEKHARWIIGRIECPIDDYEYSIVTYPENLFLNEPDAIKAAIQITDLEIAALTETQKELKGRLWRITGVMV